MTCRKLRLVLLAALLVLSLQQCSSSNSNDLLQSGSSLLYNAHSGSREHLFTVTASFNVPSSGLQVAASASSLQVAVVGGLDFSVRGLAGQSYGAVQIVLLINEDNSWSSIRVSYLLSGRSDFFLGFYLADVYIASKYSSSVSVAFKLPNWTASQGSYTSVAELSGIKTDASSFSAILNSLSFNPLSGTITLTLLLQAGGSAIENVYITYIIFPQQGSNLGFSTFNPANASPGTYSFVGLDSIKSGGSTFAGAAWTSSASNNLNCVGSGCPSSCVSVQVCTNSGGQVIGNTCFICGSGQTVVNGNCQSVNQCGNNQYWGGSSCLCVSGYVMVSGVCYQLCGANAYILNSQCVCVPGYTYSPSANQCIQQSSVICGANFVVIGGNCVCPSPFGIINNLCLSCPANSYANANGNCQCVSGYTLTSTTLSCIPQNNCFPNSTPNSLGQCVCNNGYYNQGNQCIPQTCQGGMTFNGVSCVCPTGQFTDSITGQCTYCNNYGQAVQGTSCVCSPTYYPTNSGCAPCPSNTIYSSTTKQCTCLPGYTQIGDQCVSSPTCPAGSQWNAPTSSCKCFNPGYYIINNVCAPCPANSQWNGNSCQCQGNYVMSGNACVMACPPSSVWNGQTCVCVSGSYLVGGSCVVCDPNSQYDSTQSTCICRNGYYGNWQKCYPCDSSCATCLGPANTQCTSCAGSTALTNGKCTVGCGAGQYVNVNGGCSACMANCNVCYSGDSCTTCASGYSPNLAVVNGNIVVSCSKVPTGTSSKLTLQSYTVGNGVVYQGVSMNLMPAQILADGCVICDDLLLVKVVSSFSGATARAEYVVDSQYWFLITFDFTGAAFIPTFQFTVQINPIYANYFSSPDMAQKLISAISPTTTYTAPPKFGTAGLTPKTIANPSSGTFTSSAGSSSQGQSGQTKPKISNALLVQVFS